VGSLVSLILEHEAIGFPTDFALLFSGASVMLVPSTVALMLLREPKSDADAEVDGPETGQTQDPDKPPKSPNWLGFLLRDAPFRQLLASRILVGMVSMSFPFYVGHAEDVLHLPQRVVGYFVIAQTLGGVLGSLALGPVSERQGPLRVARIGALAAMTGPLYALITHLTGNSTLTLMYPAVFAIYGIYNNAIMLGFTNYMLELPQEGMRAAYVGLSNTILGIMTLVPTLGGWLLDRTSYTVLFALTVGLASTGFLATLRLRPAPKIRGCAQ
jgi:predicted MFS family arabinose efflux permease